MQNFFRDHFLSQLSNNVYFILVPSGNRQKTKSRVRRINSLHEFTIFPSHSFFLFSLFSTCDYACRGWPSLTSMQCKGFNNLLSRALLGLETFRTNFYIWCCCLCIQVSFGIARQKKLKIFTILTRKTRSQVRIILLIQLF